MSEKKKVNTVVFMIVATVVNILLVLFFFVLLSALLAFLSSKIELSDSLYMILAGLDIMLSFVLSLLVYRKLFDWASGKWDFSSMERRRK